MLHPTQHSSVIGLGSSTQPNTGNIGYVHWVWAVGSRDPTQCRTKCRWVWVPGPNPIAGNIGSGYWVGSLGLSRATQPNSARHWVCVLGWVIGSSRATQPNIKCHWVEEYWKNPTQHCRNFGWVNPTQCWEYWVRTLGLVHWVIGQRKAFMVRKRTKKWKNRYIICTLCREHNVLQALLAMID